MSKARVPKRRFMWGETRLLMDYLRDAYPQDRWFTNMRIGPIKTVLPLDDLTESERRLLGAGRRFVDAVVIRPHEIVVIEATMREQVESVGPLLEYLELTPQTPELQEFLPRPIRGELVSPIPDPRTEALCRKLGIRFVWHRVDWLDEFMVAYAARLRRAPLSQVETRF